ncbi:MAG: diguanylate cyclase domain-containing protein [Solirubrobacteraceae bacterium]
MGDAVLQRIAGLLAGETRTAQVASRYGGDEFVLVGRRHGPRVVVRGATQARDRRPGLDIARTSPRGELGAVGSTGEWLEAASRINVVPAVPWVRAFTERLAPGCHAAERWRKRGDEFCPSGPCPPSRAVLEPR